MEFPSIDPVAIEIGPIAIRWYALAYIAGVGLGWALIVHLLKQSAIWAPAPFHGRAPMTPDDAGDLVLWAMVGIILGGRLGYVLIYGVLYCGLYGDVTPACGDLPGAYLDDPLRIIAIWEGGMAFHGGLAGVVLAIIVFARMKRLDEAQFRAKLRGLTAAERRAGADTRMVEIKGEGRFPAARVADLRRAATTRTIPLMTLGDLVAVATPIGIFFGRVANFINGELWGKPTDGPLGVIFPDPAAGGVPRHPSQLYEAVLEGLLLFVILYAMARYWNALTRPGLCIAVFFLGYGAGRAVAEFFRDSEAVLFGPVTMGMALSLPMWAAGAFFLWYALAGPGARAAAAR